MCRHLTFQLKFVAVAIVQEVFIHIFFSYSNTKCLYLHQGRLQTWKSSSGKTAQILFAKFFRDMIHSCYHIATYGHNYWERNLDMLHKIPFWWTMHYFQYTAVEMIFNSLMIFNSVEMIFNCSLVFVFPTRHVIIHWSS